MGGGRHPGHMRWQAVAWQPFSGAGQAPELQNLTVGYAVDYPSTASQGAGPIIRSWPGRCILIEVCQGPERLGPARWGRLRLTAEEWSGG